MGIFKNWTNGGWGVNGKLDAISVNVYYKYAGFEYKNHLLVSDLEVDEATIALNSELVRALKKRNK